MKEESSRQIEFIAISILAGGLESILAFRLHCKKVCLAIDERYWKLLYTDWVRLSVILISGTSFVRKDYIRM